MEVEAFEVEGEEIEIGQGALLPGRQLQGMPP
jgi:hypothetical protein